MSRRALILGGGHAAAELATSLRDQGWAGSIEVLSAEPCLPYHRPPLSKAFLSGAVTAESLSIKQPAAFEKAAAQVRLGVQAVQIDLAQRAVRLADGAAVPFDVLALATGARPRTLQVPGAEAAAGAVNAHVLRTLADATALRSQLVAGARVVVAGAGYIGLELAASATALGCQVVVVEAQARVLQRVAGEAVARFVQQVHEAAGVEVRLGCSVTAIAVSAGRVQEVTLSDGAVLPADVLVTGIGVIPNVELAEQAGLVIDNGIAVDAQCRTSAEDVVAAGDCTSQPSALYGGRRIRLESVPNALDQARVAAATLNGKVRAGELAPWFWSEQFDLRIKSVGLLTGHDRCVLRGDPAGRAFCAFYLQGSRVLAVDTINRAPEFLLAKRIVAEQLEIPDSVLADEGVALKDVLPPPAPAAAARPG